MEEGYDVAHICLNVYEINSSSKRHPQYNKNFCDQCETETITKCKHCRKKSDTYSNFINSIIKRG